MYLNIKDLQILPQAGDNAQNLIWLSIGGVQQNLHLILSKKPNTSSCIPECGRVNTLDMLRHSCGLQNHFAEIVPEADVDARVAMYSEAEEERLLGDHPSFVIDAIDDIDTKVISNLITHYASRVRAFVA